MRPLVPLLRRHPLWTVSMVLAVPLGALLLLQLFWLAHARDMFAGAVRADRHDYLEKVATEIEFAYRNGAERALNLPAYLFTEDRLDEAAPYFKRRGVEAAEFVFASRLLAEDWSVSFYDATRERMVHPAYSPLVRSVVKACTELKVRAERGEVVYSTELLIDESEPGRPIILNPIVDRRSRIIGVAGMVLDASVLAKQVLPRIIERSREGSGALDADVTVFDGQGRLAFTTGDPELARNELDIALPFVFTDWRIGLSSRAASPEELARRNFAVNTVLLGAVWLLLIVALWAGLRTISREIKLSRIKADFVSNVSHELRTPLASIRVFGELMSAGRVTAPEKVREYGGFIESESRRLTQLINNILDFSRIESQGKTYRFEPVSLDDLLRETLGAFEVRLRRDGFELTVEGPDERLPRIVADRQAVAQAIGNVLDNAIKYSGAARSIRVTLRRQGGEAQLAVTDQGIGIPRADMERIFERFHRVGTGFVHDVKGSGLGLALVRHIMDAHGGCVTVRSEIGRGSTFTLHLPLERPENGAVRRRGGSSKHEAERTG